MNLEECGIARRVAGSGCIALFGNFWNLVIRLQRWKKDNKDFAGTEQLKMIKVA